MSCELHFIENGKRRKAKRAICKKCKKSFLCRKSKNWCPNYCSRECYCTARRKRQKLKCAQCGRDFERAFSKQKNSKHAVFFCSKKCKDVGQSLGGKCAQIRPSHYGTGGSDFYVRSYIGRRKNPSCTDCNEKKRYLLIVHHKDGNRNNGKKSNLEVVCWNCHARRHLRRQGGNLIYDSKSLTTRGLLNRT